MLKMKIIGVLSHMHLYVYLCEHFVTLPIATDVLTPDLNPDLWPLTLTLTSGP